MTYNEAVLPDRVAELMRERGITQQQLARVLRLHQQSVSQRLLGQRRFSIEDLVAMSNYFNCTPGELLAADVLFTGGL
jgi:transcriptional regulator with XRE-family HTH domain